jgi:CarD family transcriptional regulator
MLIIGRKVVYPCQGPCLISAIVERTIDNTPMAFYQLLVLDDGGGNLLIPVEKAQAIGIRPLLSKSDIPKLLDHLKKQGQSAEDYRQRNKDHSRLFASGSAFDLAEIVESLTKLGETKSLSIGERKALDKAKRLLVCELSEVLGETREEAELQVDKALAN